MNKLFWIVLLIIFYFLIGNIVTLILDLEFAKYSTSQASSDSYYILKESKPSINAIVDLVLLVVFIPIGFFIIKKN